MRVAVISDVHSNLQALEAVLADVYRRAVERAAAVRIGSDARDLARALMGTRRSFGEGGSTNRAERQT